MHESRIEKKMISLDEVRRLISLVGESWKAIQEEKYYACNYLLDHIFPPEIILDEEGEKCTNQGSETE